MKFERIYFPFDASKCVSTDFSLSSAKPGSHGFLPVSFVPMCTDKKLQSDMALLEYIHSYLDVLRTIAGQFMSDYSSLRMYDGEVRIYDSSCSLPGIYLSCHVVELVLKYVSHSVFGVSLSGTHDLKMLWARLREFLVQNLDSNDMCILENLDAFMSMMADFSKGNNTRFRYAVDAGGSVHQQAVEYVDLCVLVRSVELFVSQMLSLDASFLSEPKLCARICLSDGNSYFERWLFGFDTSGKCIGKHLCEGLLQLSYLNVELLELARFSNDDSGKYERVRFKNTLLYLPPNYNLYRLVDYNSNTMDSFCVNNPNNMWSIRAIYDSQPICFSGSRFGVRLGVSYANSKSVRLKRLMQDLFDYLTGVYGDCHDDEPIL